MEALLLADDFYEDAVGQFAVDEMDYAVFHEAFEDLPRLGRLRCGCGRTRSAAGTGREG